MLMVLTTTPTAEEGDVLAEAIVTEKLAACVQILPPMTSVYVWNGEVKKEREYLLLIKTLPEKYELLEGFIKANHSYSVPEIIAIDGEASVSYGKWMESVLLHSKRPE